MKRTTGSSTPPPYDSSDDVGMKASQAARHRATEAKKRLQEFHRVRHYLLTQVARGTPVILKLQSFRSAPLDWFFIVWSFLGDKVPYVLLLPWFFWIYDPPLARMWLMLLVLGTTIGNILKNIFALPRPPAPPLWVHKRLDDFGLPSTHSLNAITMPWFLLWWIWDRLGSDSTRAICVACFAFYSISMFFSRQYLAAHSPADVVTGIMLGVPILYVWTLVCERYDYWVLNSEMAPLIAIIIAFTTILFHPRSSRPSPSFKYTVALMGIGLGLISGAWGLRHWDDTFVKRIITNCINVPGLVQRYVPGQYQLIVTNTATVYIGLGVMLGSYVVVKFATYIGVGILFDMAGVASIVKILSTSFSKLALPHPTALDNLDHPQLKDKSELPAETPKKDAKTISEFTGGFAVGFLITYVIPLLLNCMGLMSDERMLR